MKTLILAVCSSLSLVAGTALAEVDSPFFSDFNCDGVVDNQDFVIFSEAFRGFDPILGIPVEPAVGDFNRDGVTDGQDFVIFSEDYRASMGIIDVDPFPLFPSAVSATEEAASLAQVLSIPEPSTVAVLGVGLLCSGLKRRASR